MSLRVRVALVMALGMAAALLLQGLLGFVAFQRSVIADMDHDLAAFTQTVMVQVQQADDLRAVSPSYVGYLVHARALRGSQVAADWTGFPKALASNAPFGQAQTAGPWRTLQMTVRRNDQTFTVQTALTSPEFTAGLRNYRTTLLMSVLVVTGLGATAAYALSGYALRPLQALTQASARIAASGHLNEAVAMKSGSRDELSALAQAFNQMLVRLAAFRSREARFNRHAAHELRTPLAAMRLALDAVHGGYAEPEEALTALDIELSRAQRLTAALLILAREGRLGQTEPVDLAALAQDSAAKSGADYVGPAHAWVPGDATLICRTLENLLENADQHAPGTVVVITVEQHDVDCLLSVTDLGPGVPPEALTQLTEEFFRTQSSRGAGSGSGLGLSVVRHVVDAHGGTLSIVPNHPQGLTVKLRFPRDAEQVPE